jgi:hypothetical protein
MNPMDKVAKHLFADLKVSDHAIFEGTNRLNVAGRSTDHPLRLCANS